MSATMLPDLSACYELSPLQVAEFQRNGHILLPCVAASQEVAAYRNVILAAREQSAPSALPWRIATLTAKHS